MKIKNIVLSVVTMSIFTAPVLADDSPQFRGVERTGVSKETGLLKEWAADGPQLVWKATDLGLGHATPSVAKGIIYGMGLIGEEEVVWALEEKSGRLLWKTKIAGFTELQARQGGNGSRATPTIDGTMLYTVGVGGDFVCMEAKTGKILWRKHLVHDFGGRVPTWGYCESPLIDGPNVLVTPGNNDATMVLVNKRTGNVVWKNSVPIRNTPAYASAISATVGGKKQYIQFLSGGVVGVDAASGKFLWSYNAPANRNGISCSMPLYKDGFVFAATAYNTGGGQAKLTATEDGFKAEETYFLREMQNHHGGMVIVGDHLYGTGNNSLFCVEFKTGNIVWEDRSPGKGSLTYADGMLYCRSERGPVTLVEANPTKYVQRGQFQQPDRSYDPAWAYPVVANGKLYIRDQGTLLCYDVKGTK
jgi:outer membrane protein assembly factor BamB